MVPESSYVFYSAYFFVCVTLGVAYVRVQAMQPLTITTREFKTFQKRFLGAYAPLMLCELISQAFFFWILTARGLTVARCASMFTCAQLSTTACNFLVESFDVVCRRDKCVISALLYILASLSLLSSNIELLLIGRVCEGCASALFHTAFEAYLINEHAVNGFPDDWLSQTFSIIECATSLCAVLCGVSGAFSRALLSTAGPPLLAASLAVASGWALVHTAAFWPLDTHSSKFSLTHLTSSIFSTVSASSSNKPVRALLAIQTCFESSCIVLTFFWAPYLNWTVAGAAAPPPGIVWGTLTAAAAAGSFVYQVNTLRWVLIVAGGAFMVAAAGSSPHIALACCTIIQACVGAYWPCIGYLRGRLIPYEFRAASMLVTRAAAVAIVVLLLNTQAVLHAPALMLSLCAALCACGVYFHAQIEGVTSTAHDMLPLPHDEEY